MSVRKGGDVLAGGAPLTVDSALNAASANPIQNGAVTRAISSKQDTMSAGDGITITNNTVVVGNLDCGTMS